MKKLVLLAALAATLPSTAHGQVFDFEGAAITTVSGYTATVDGLTLGLTREGGKTFDFVDIREAGFGTRSLSPFGDLTMGRFVANFSAGLSQISVQFADFGGDVDALSLLVYSGLNGTGTLLGSATGALTSTTSFSSARLSVNVSAPFRSAIFNGGSTSYPNSVFYDNIRVTQAVAAVPEPASWALMLTGFGGIGFAMRRSKNKVATTAAFA